MTERAKWGLWQQIHHDRRWDIEAAYGPSVCGALTGELACGTRAQWMSAMIYLDCVTLLCDGCKKRVGEGWTPVRTLWARGQEGIQRMVDGPPFALGGPRGPEE